MKRLSAILLPLLLLAFATGFDKTPSKIRYQGEGYDLLFNPLEEYFREHPAYTPLALFGEEAGRDSVILKPWTEEERIYSDFYEIDEQGKLWLTEVRAYFYPIGEESFFSASLMPRMFPGRERVWTEWVSGEFVLAGGHWDAVVTDGSDPERYLLVKVEKGKVLEVTPLEEAPGFVWEWAEF